MRIRLDMATPGQPAGSRPPRPTEPQPAPPLLSSSSLPASVSAAAAAAGQHWLTPPWSWEPNCPRILNEAGLSSRLAEDAALAAAAGMILFYFSILEHFVPTFRTHCKMGLILPRWGIILPRIPPPTPVLYSAVTHLLQGQLRIRNTPNSIQKHPFWWPELESGQNERLFGQPGPNWAKCLKGGQNCSRSGQKILFIDQPTTFSIQLACQCPFFIVLCCDSCIHLCPILLSHCSSAAWGTAFSCIPWACLLLANGRYRNNLST